MIVFVDAIDDFVIAAWLSGPSSSETVAVRIYSDARGAVTPALNALGAMMLSTSIVVLLHRRSRVPAARASADPRTRGSRTSWRPKPEPAHAVSRRRERRVARLWRNATTVDPSAGRS